ncbi:unnamed protein product [Polarella glacialis]|uniref:Uncharacterized protein n=1 Tax=Polarella glacialis TaxID=89957 RepID=A0A813JR05_POLGL|nr:unnamed protein product [Polarella glacialis]
MSSSSTDLYSRARGSVRSAADRDAAEHDARVLATIHANDALAVDELGRQNKKARNQHRGLLFEIRAAMSYSDRECLIQHALDQAHVRAGSAESLAVSVPEARFKAGQSVLQWWSSWFSDPKVSGAAVLAKGKKRASWYSADIIRPDGIQSIHYAGGRRAVPGHTYLVT